jgi:hypothetical protein
MPAPERGSERAKLITLALVPCLLPPIPNKLFYYYFELGLFMHYARLFLFLNKKSIQFGGRKNKNKNYNIRNKIQRMGKPELQINQKKKKIVG